MPIFCIASINLLDQTVYVVAHKLILKPTICGARDAWIMSSKMLPIPAAINDTMQQSKCVAIISTHCSHIGIASNLYHLKHKAISIMPNAHF